MLYSNMDLQNSLRSKFITTKLAWNITETLIDVVICNMVVEAPPTFKINSTVCNLAK